MRKLYLATLLLAYTLFLSAPSTTAQNGQPQVSVVNLQIVRNSDGSQSVITPKGDMATLPGAGVNGNVAEIYFGSQGGFWYVDKSGQTVDLTPTYQSLQNRRARQAATAQVPQYAPMPQYGGQTQYMPPPQQDQQQYSQDQNSQEQSDDSSGGRVGSALGTAAVAAGSAAMGAAMANNNYWNAPYGTPMYYGNGHPYYYGNNGERREFDDLNQNQKAAMYNQRKIKDQNQQKAIAQGQANRQERQDGRGEQAGRREHSGEQANFQKQQDWYQNQMRDNPSRFQGQRQDSNPFVAQGHDHGGRGGREAGRRSHEGGSARASRGGGGGRGGRGGGGRRR